MEFVAICLVAVALGLRGFRVGVRAYAWSALAIAVAGLWTYHSTG